jgi:hypothetical protein
MTAKDSANVISGEKRLCEGQGDGLPPDAEASIRGSSRQVPRSVFAGHPGPAFFRDLIAGASRTPEATSVHASSKIRHPYLMTAV